MLHFDPNFAKYYGLLESIIYATVQEQECENGFQYKGMKWMVKRRHTIFDMFDFATEEEVVDAINHLIEDGEMFHTRKDHKRYHDMVYLSTGTPYDLCDTTSNLQEWTKPCYVYYTLNTAKDKVKIGISLNPESRIRNMQTSIGERLDLIWTIRFSGRKEALAAESFLHETFSDYRVKDLGLHEASEWFDSSIVPVLIRDYKNERQIKELMEKEIVRQRI